jgi:hypothetical protein
MPVIWTSEETHTREYALACIRQIHKVTALPDGNTCRIYRPFWYAVADFSGKAVRGVTISGNVVCLGDARLPRFGTLGAYPYRLEDPLDLREHGLNFRIIRLEPEEGSQVLEPLRESGELRTLFKLRYLVKSMRRTMRIGSIRFEPAVAYSLIYRPYWKIDFMPRFGKETAEALICMDEVLLTGKNP